MSATLQETSVISRKLAVLLEELNEECTYVQSLIAHLKLSNLTAGQVEEILAELNAAVVHLSTHTTNLDDVIAEEIDKL
ncbi:hypothetical protein GWO43_17405 [candidate division KSB1 bacterium]|nr:hypothetical protein [candidate division KSB1 bacterium]NIR69638.1 hypothetical protein [candidate division KSB1 bacterium]NIS25745.1 hypothetical protein [candidate division KSB1 bacterium]NIT72614.1 hypothetical protein [candidate division KSB1 bacterium]NIU26426.1 hypothetical protein [candidate division KSB1 bacterium]